MSKKIAVIGAGAAGMFAAGKAGESGVMVHLYEKNSIPGKKIRITGKGRCNITNLCDSDELISNTPGNGNFLFSCYNAFSNYDIISFFEDLGVETKVERGNRVFPKSDKSQDVIDALYKWCRSNNVKFFLDTGVREVVYENNSVKGINLIDGRFIKYDAVIVATGGMSYKATGSTGDGYKIAESAGHTIVDLKPSLVPLNIKDKWVKELQGLSLKNVSVTVLNKNKTIYTGFGEMLFTHFGVSGPLILTASRHLVDCNFEDTKIIIDLKPALDEQKLDNRINRDFAKSNKKQFSNSLDELLPKKLIPVIIKLSKIPPQKQANQISKKERKTLIDLLKSLTLTIAGLRPINEAIITKGGINVKEISPKTMESKKITGLYFAGEVLDLDAYTGGFNLTIAFSTGYTAGVSAARES